MDLPDRKPAKITDEDWKRLRDSYEATIRAYAAAGAVIGQRLAQAVTPTEAEFAEEEKALEALTEARRAFWVAFRLG